MKKNQQNQMPRQFVPNLRIILFLQRAMEILVTLKKTPIVKRIIRDRILCEV